MIYRMWRCCPLEIVFLPHFLKVEVKVKASEPPYVVKLLLRVSKGMFHVRYFCYNEVSFCVSGISWR